MNSNRLLCNIKGVRKPIIGLIPGKKIVRDESGIELSKRQFLNIKHLCNVFGVIDDKEYIIHNGIRFDELLEMQNNTVKEESNNVKLNITESIIVDDKPIITEPAKETTVSESIKEEPNTDPESEVVIEEPVNVIEESTITDEPDIIETEPVNEVNDNTTVENVLYADGSNTDEITNTVVEDNTTSNDNRNNYHGNNNRKNKKRNR